MYKAVLFDFDGTLLDTHKLIIAGLNLISLKNRGVGFDDQEHGRVLGKPLEEQIRMLCSLNVRENTAEFIRWYGENHDIYAKPYDDVDEMLLMLKAEGYKLGIVTNNSRQGMNPGLALLGLEDLFDVIVTRDDVKACKPSPEGIQKALGALGVVPDECIYVGDSAGDMAAARGAGVMPVLVAWTTMTLEQIRVAAPAELIESPYEIPFLLSLMNAETA